MKHLLHISDLSIRKRPGNKALSLMRMHSSGFRVPTAYVVPAATIASLRGDREEPRNALREEIDKSLKRPGSYAVRSSAEVEDSDEHSFAGQFVTFLDVEGTEAIMEAIIKVKASAEAVMHGGYAKKAAFTGEAPGIGVIIQEMVDTAWSGVAFSINPITGRSEYVIEGIRGTGRRLMEEGVNPERWTWYSGNWEGAGPGDAYLCEALSGMIASIPRLCKLFGGEVDVEWAFDGKQLWYLQCRPVTIHEFPNIYSNRISREVLPGMIKPLVWSVNIPLVNSAWIRLLEELLGRLNIRPEQLSRSIYYRAYFNMGTLGALFNRLGLPRDSLESLMGRKDPSGKSSFRPGLKILRYLPNLARFVFSNLFLGRKFKRHYKRINAATTELTIAMNSAGIDDYPSLFQRIWKVSLEAAYYNITIPLAMQISNRMLHGKLKNRGISFEHIDFTSEYPELSGYDPGNFIDRLREVWKEIPAETRHILVGYKDISRHPGDPFVGEFARGIEQLLERFGHLSESGNDFSYAPWNEDPDFPFQMIIGSRAAEPVVEKEGNRITLQTGGIPRNAYRRAGQYRLFREMISFEYTRCYGLFRKLFLLTGEHFVEKGWMEKATDVFYLSLEEHDRLLEGAGKEEVLLLREKAAKVETEMKRLRDISLPSVVYGETPPILQPEGAETMNGIPVSPGIFDGELMVVRGYGDFGKPVDGKILVIPFSDVGWTPLLMRAGAIVSESGGMLSHASIIARELKLPAVSSVDHACLLEDGTRATIDGFYGKLIIQRRTDENTG